MYLYLSKIGSAIHSFNFGHISSGHSVYRSKEVRIRGYFSKSKGGPHPKTFGQYYCRVIWKGNIENLPIQVAARCKA